MPETMTHPPAMRRFAGAGNRMWRIRAISLIAAAAGWLAAPAAAMDSPAASAMAASEKRAAVFERRVANLWGADNVWRPSATIWVQYEPDLGERSAVDFENGRAEVQILLAPDGNPVGKAVRAHLRQGVGNLILAAPDDPVEMVAAQTLPLKMPAGPLPAGSARRPYRARDGDSLPAVARRFHMPLATLAEMNGLDASAPLFADRPLTVVAMVSHDLALDPAPRPAAANAPLLDQIRMADGRAVSTASVGDFAAQVVRTRPPVVKPVVGEDGIARLVVGATFALVDDHLQVRADRFRPLVTAHARKWGLDPALIMAIIHTESMFNPRARSDAPAYGLMQLVPHTAGREAYAALYDKPRTLTPRYLYDPENNIKLGATYYSILKNRYMGAIRDPQSRIYCAVAAYNAGASNVGSAFIARKSIRQAIPVINRLTPTEVYERLVADLPMKESRNYVRKVLRRIRLYKNR